MLCDLIKASDGDNTKLYLNLLQLNLHLDMQVIGKKELLATPEGRVKLAALAGAKMRTVEVLTLLKLAFELGIDEPMAAGTTLH